MISKDKVEHYVWGGVCDGWHLVKSAALSVIQERMPPGASEVRHFHRASRQFFFILSGTATLEVGGRVEVLRAHEGVEVAPGAPHRIRNESKSDVEFLVVSQPASHGDRVIAEIQIAE
ncbi:MAG TPA: cupin domain-containing protein [Pyrinomonadaceae bacterium]|jgi:mannose-6-phosphate isomerase-like protein (cupin superfamily)